MPLHERYPPVIQLAIHLENGQRVYFIEQTARDRAAAEPPQTTLTAFLSLCQEDEFARTLLYTEVPKYYTWNKNVWTRRKRGRIVQDGVYETDMIGRLYTVSPSLGDCLYLRLLLHEVRGPSSFNDLKTVDGALFPTYRESCIGRGLLDDDSALHNTLAEAATTATPVAIRCLFATIICFCLPLDLCDHHHGSMIEDFFLQQPGITGNAAKNMALLDIEKQVQLMSGKTLSVYGLPEQDGAEIHRGGIEYQRELVFNPEAEAAKCEASLQRLTNDQRVVFDAFMAAVTEGYGAIYFLDAPGGCGKTFLLETVLAAIRAQRKIVLATASSGLAATLVHGGRTVHSTFKVPLNLQSTDSPMCSIKKETTLAKLIEDCSAIIIDEAPMLHRNVLEAMDRSFWGIRASDTPMGGIPCLLSGDFRQVLPVVPSGTRANIVNASLKKSYLWHYVREFHLTTNMRVQLCGDGDAHMFSTMLLSVGDGTYPRVVEPDVISLDPIALSVPTRDLLIQSVYKDFLDNVQDREWLAGRAILCPRNEGADSINKVLVEKLLSDPTEYRSIDAAVSEEDTVRFPTEFLNSIEVSGMPPHRLHLKVGTPVMLMRSINPPALMNGTKLMRDLIEVVVASGAHKDQTFFEPRITLQPSDSQLPFAFSRKQFPLKPCFAITFSKVQGQSLKTVGLELSSPVFTHGMLYVGLSRVGSKNGVYIHAPGSRTRNVVYSEVLH